MITREDVTKIAKLAKLSLDEKETERFAREMTDILQYVEKLNKLDLKDIEATSHAVSVTNVFREDEAKQSPVRDKALEQAPSAEQNMFRVPRVIG
ncbi:MAG: Asp-tRNA(Asn)/Glu-tRNA(Gln) amidotransferase subunit GatC [Deltaproteobacteria bacterium]|nr:Asp-tRNA(Asn)/Glu-tRNA(Gln) amidotransferase subunit GatC [Deltaproteobacteria bacterium]